LRLDCVCSGHPERMQGLRTFPPPPLGGPGDPLDHPVHKDQRSMTWRYCSVGPGTREGTLLVRLPYGHQFESAAKYVTTVREMIDDALKRGQHGGRHAVRAPGPGLAPTLATTYCSVDDEVSTVPVGSGSRPLTWTGAMATSRMPKARVVSGEMISSTERPFCIELLAWLRGQRLEPPTPGAGSTASVARRWTAASPS
jgi:hypothetical protein